MGNRLFNYGSNLSILILGGDIAFGKPIGVASFSWLSVRTGLAFLPNGVGWGQILGAGALAGIGLTMSLFAANLAFGPTPVLETAKVGILAASFAPSVAGAFILSKTNTGRDVAPSKTH